MAKESMSFLLMTLWRVSLGELFKQMHVHMHVHAGMYIYSVNINMYMYMHTCTLSCRNLFDVFLKPYFLEAYRPVHKG